MKSWKKMSAREWREELKQQYNRHRARSAKNNTPCKAWLCKTCMSVNQDTEQVCGYCESPRPQIGT